MLCVLNIALVKKKAMARYRNRRVQGHTMGYNLCISLEIVAFYDAMEVVEYTIIMGSTCTNLLFKCRFANHLPSSTPPKHYCSIIITDLYKKAEYPKGMVV